MKFLVLWGYTKRTDLVTALLQASYLGNEICQDRATLEKTTCQGGFLLLKENTFRKSVPQEIKLIFSLSNKTYGPYLRKLHKKRYSLSNNFYLCTL